MPGFLYQTVEAGREQDSRETESERECVRDRAWLEVKDSVGNKIDR
jgi:hypothetical protein